jgi:pimeloyl-ACP methyl ester carboxylesterase
MTDQNFITVAGGRKIYYVEYGDKDGMPVFYFHGAPSSCYEGLLIGDEVFKQHQLRIIAPNRPGIGQSDPVKERGFSDWASDVASMADALGIQKFSVLGFSGGSGYVSACASAIPDRLHSAVIVSGGLADEFA